MGGVIIDSPPNDTELPPPLFTLLLTGVPETSKYQLYSSMISVIVSETIIHPAATPPIALAPLKITVSPVAL